MTNFNIRYPFFVRDIDIHCRFNKSTKPIATIFSRSSILGAPSDVTTGGENTVLVLYLATT